MRWPESGYDIRSDNRMARLLDTLGSDFYDIEAIARFCVERFSPHIIRPGDDKERNDRTAAERAGILEGSTEWGKVCGSNGYDEDVISVMLHILDALGGPDWTNYCVGVCLLHTAHKEVMAPLKDTDEDKRAAVTLKKVELYGKVKATIDDLRRQGEQLCVDEDMLVAASQRTGNMKHIKRPPGSTI